MDRLLHQLGKTGKQLTPFQKLLMLTNSVIGHSIRLLTKQDPMAISPVLHIAERAKVLEILVYLLPQEVRYEAIRLQESCSNFRKSKDAVEIRKPTPQMSLLILLPEHRKAPVAKQV